ncbi:MAG: DUF454 family protein [Nitrospirae bacterium]|nr:DUF454 family protein [Nitrospirota bacterium]
MVKRSFYFVGGIVFIFLGIIGFLLPIIPGFIPFIIGVVMLSRSSKTIRGYMLRIKARYPKQFEKMHELREKMGRHRFK